MHSGFHNCVHAFRMENNYLTICLTQGNKGHVLQLSLEEVVELMGFLKFASHGLQA